MLTPRPTPLLLQSKAPSKLVPDLGHTGIQTSLGVPEMPPILPNARLNPNFVKLANRRAHEVAFDRVRVERKKIIAPLQNFTHENHYDFMNKVMIDILEERERNAERAKRMWDEAKASLGFEEQFETMSEASFASRCSEAAGKAKTKKGPGGLETRPKKYFNTLGLFECLWDSMEPKKTSVKKYGGALPKNKTNGETFTLKNGRDIVIPENWDPEAVFDAHFGTFKPPDDPLAEPDPTGGVIEGMNKTITRDEIKTMSLVRKGFASPVKDPPAHSLNQTI